MKIKQLNERSPGPVVAVLGNSATNGDGIFFRDEYGKVYHFNGTECNLCPGAQWEMVQNSSGRTCLYAGDKLEITL